MRTVGHDELSCDSYGAPDSEELDMPSLSFEEISLKKLKRNPHNARTHSRRQITKLAASIRAHGFCNPILIDENEMIVAGHGRYDAAAVLKLNNIPVVRITHLNDQQKRALAIADNRIALDAGWDMEILSEELAVLSSPELDFPVETTGFEAAEIDNLLIEPAPEGGKPDPADEFPAVGPQASAITHPGDLWILGGHRILCGDALDPASYQTLLEVELAQMVFCDPPFNVSIGGHVSGLGRVKHREFAMASGEMTAPQFIAFLKQAFRNMAEQSVDGSIHYIFMDWRHLREILRAGTEIYDGLINLCVWAKTNAGMGSLYRSRHELVLVFKKGKAPHINNVELGKHGRWRTNVWEYAGVNTFRRGRDADLAVHPTVKPVALAADAIRDCSRRGGIILDPFGGSGTTLLAAERTGRRARLMEIDPAYIDVTIERWQKMTGGKAILNATGQSFEEVRHERS